MDLRNCYCETIFTIILAMLGYDFTTYQLFVFDVEEGGPSFTAAIPGVDFPPGLCLTEAPDLMGAMSPCPRKGSVCQDQITLPNFPFT